MKKKIGFVWSDGSFEFNSNFGCDKDVLVELVVCEVRMINWWVMVCDGVSGNIGKLIEKIEEKVRIELSDLSDDCFGGKKNYMLNFESCNIMSEEFNIGLCEVEGEIYGKIEELMNVFEYDEEYGRKIDGLVEVCEEIEIEMEEKIGKRVKKIVEGFGDKNGGWMKEIVESS